MSVKLTELHGANERECLLMDKELESFGGREMDDDMQARILSSVMRKAGFEMKENITVNKTKKKSKRFVGFMIAAAVVATGAISAGAYAVYNEFMNKQSVEYYFGEEAVDKLEGMELVINKSCENEHFRVTADTALSDGESAMVVFTIEKLSEETRSLIRFLPGIELCYADTGERCPTNGSSFGMFFTKDGDNDPSGDAVAVTLNIAAGSDIDLSRMIKIKFEDKKEFQSDPNIYYDSMELVLDLSANVDTAVLTSEDGREITMLPFGMSGVSLSDDEMDMFTDTEPEIFFITPDGTAKPLQQRFISISKENDKTDTYSIFIDRFINIDDYIGVEICGDIYWNTNKDMETTPEE